MLYAFKGFFCLLCLFCFLDNGVWHSFGLMFFFRLTTDLWKVQTNKLHYPQHEIPMHRVFSPIYPHGTTNTVATHVARFYFVHVPTWSLRFGKALCAVHFAFESNIFYDFHCLNAFIRIVLYGALMNKPIWFERKSNSFVFAIVHILFNCMICWFIFFTFPIHSQNSETKSIHFHTLTGF